MSFDVFVQAFHQGDNALFPIAVVEHAFAGFIAAREDVRGNIVLRIAYPVDTTAPEWVPGSVDFSEIYMGRDSGDALMTSGFMVSGPASHPAFHEALLVVLRATPTALFWEKVLIVGSEATLAHVPASMVAHTGAQIRARI